MLIVGAKGFAKEVLEVCIQNGDTPVFFDNVNGRIDNRMFDKYVVITSFLEAEKHLSNSNEFTIGIGKPILRKKMYNKFTEIGGILTSTISKNSDIGSCDVLIGEGANILNGVTISNSVTIGIAPLIYYYSIITHDCVIGDFVEISPRVTLLGRSKIGDYTQIGAGAIILPDIKVGTNVVIGAGCVVTKDVPDNSIIAGIPGKVIRKNSPNPYLK